MMCEFIKQGCEVVAASEAPEKDWVDVFGSINVKYRQIFVAKNGINPFADMKTLNDIVNLIEQEKPDKILHITPKQWFTAVWRLKDAVLTKCMRLLPGSARL